MKRIRLGCRAPTGCLGDGLRVQLQVSNRRLRAAGLATTCANLAPNATFPQSPGRTRPVAPSNWATSRKTNSRGARRIATPCISDGHPRPILRLCGATLAAANKDNLAHTFLFTSVGILSQKRVKARWAIFAVLLLVLRKLATERRRSPHKQILRAFQTESVNSI